MNKAQIIQVIDRAIQEANDTKQKVDSVYTFIEMTARASALTEARNFILTDLDEPVQTEEPKTEKVRKESK